MLAKSNADVVSSFPVDQSDQIMLIDDNGQLIRCPVSDIRIMGRNTQGVKIFNIDEKSSVSSQEIDVHMQINSLHIFFVLLRKLYQKLKRTSQNQKAQ